eukprot:9552269-Alexandrium_andersonii.AAC.1
MRHSALIKGISAMPASGDRSQTPKVRAWTAGPRGQCERIAVVPSSATALQEGSLREAEPRLLQGLHLRALSSEAQPRC